MSDVMQRMELKAVEKLSREFRDSVRSAISSAVENKIGWIRKEWSEDIDRATKGLCDAFDAQIREKALSSVQANFSELMDLLSQALDKESES